MITIGRMAERYGMLPSEVAAKATTYDLMISDVLATYDRYEQTKAKGKVDPTVFGLTQEELKAMV
tara:strand:+ start:258 stop:452 length:195 start_codon:yes stop_codon:yes gene_type:complete